MEAQQLARSKRCLSKMEPGQYRRIPGGDWGLIGYYLICPWCGFRCMILLAEEVGASEDDDGRPTFERPVTCPKKVCGVEFRVENGMAIQCTMTT